MLRGFILLFVCCYVLTSATKPKSNLPAVYERWLKEEVTYIITDEERKEFLKLPTDATRDKFIEEFWDIRNPVRGGATNSYKEEHYRRLQYANDNFGRRSNTPGWLTDMGRSWILFGKPESRAPYTGYGQLYPLELWFYSNKTSDPAIPSFFTLLFFIPEDIGEYRYYRPSLDTPLKLVRGSQFNSNSDVYKFLKPIAGDLAKAAFTLIPGDPIDTTNFTVDMSSDMLVSKIQNLANDQFNLRRLRELRSLRARVDSTFLVAEDQPLSINSIVLADPTGQSWVDYSVLVREAGLGRQQPESRQLTVLSGFRLLTEKGELIAEDEEERSYDAFGADGQFRPFQIAGRLPLVPGSYKLECKIVDRSRSRIFHGERKFNVVAPATVAIAEPLLFSSGNRVTRPDSVAPFQYFGVQFQPFAGAEFPRSEPLRLLYTMQVAPGHPQDFSVEYLVAHAQEKESRLTVKDEIHASEFRDGRLLKSKTIPLTNLVPGPYRVVVTVRPLDGPAVLSAASLSVRLGEAANLAPLYFLESSRKTASPAGSSYIRALEAISFRDQPAAIRYMVQALDSNPGNTSAGQYLVETWFESRQFAPVVTLYRKLGMKPFEGSAESLAQISLSFARTGDRRGAQEILTTARSIYPDNSLLLAASKAISK
jgi:GWxTD domain-containing protein